MTHERQWQLSVSPKITKWQPLILNLEQIFYKKNNSLYTTLSHVLSFHEDLLTFYVIKYHSKLHFYSRFKVRFNNIYKHLVLMLFKQLSILKHIFICFVIYCILFQYHIINAGIRCHFLGI